MKQNKSFLIAQIITPQLAMSIEWLQVSPVASHPKVDQPGSTSCVVWSTLDRQVCFSSFMG